MVNDQPWFSSNPVREKGIPSIVPESQGRNEPTATPHAASATMPARP